MTAGGPTSSPTHALHLVAVHMLPTPLGRRWRTMLEPHRSELVHHYSQADLQHQINSATIALASLATGPKDATVAPEMANSVAAILDTFTRQASPGLRDVLTQLRDQARQAGGRPLTVVLDEG